MVAIIWQIQPRVPPEPIQRPRVTNQPEYTSIERAVIKQTKASINNCYLFGRLLLCSKITYLITTNNIIEKDGDHTSNT